MKGSLKWIDDNSLSVKYKDLELIIKVFILNI